MMMGHPLRSLALLALAWMALVAAAPRPAPVQLPLPNREFLALVPIAAVPLDKPTFALPDTGAPAPPLALAALPPVNVASWAPTWVKETSVTPPPGTAPCFPKLTARQHLECGRARLVRGELEDAARDLAEAARGSNPEVVHEARYWQAEALYRLGRFPDAERLFYQVYRDVPREDIGLYSVYSVGHTRLQQRDYEHARESFEVTRNLVRTGPLSFAAQHWRALSLYYLGRYSDARQGWEALEKTNPPPDLGRQIPFWLGESLAKLGDHVAAETQLKRFADRGAHPLLPTATLRLGWASLRAGQVPAALAAFRQAQPMSLLPDEREWLQLGLAFALTASGDFAGAEQTLRGLSERSEERAKPALLDLAEKLRKAGKSAEAHALHQYLLGRQHLTPGERAWVLFNEAEVFRTDGALDDARTHYDLARKVDATSQLGWRAGLRVAQLNFELREFAQAGSEVATLLSQPTPLELRSAALVLAGEAAYYARDYEAAANWRRKLLNEPGADPAILKDAKLSLAWAELRRDSQSAEARRLFSEFARDFASDPAAPDALMLSAELAEGAGDVAAAQADYERMRLSYPTHPRTPLALLDGAILMLRTNRVPNAMLTLQEFLKAAPDSPQVPRARTARGAGLLAAGSPAEAELEFATALEGGEGPVAHLGAGIAAIARKRWGDAERHLTAAREAGLPAVADQAEYALAVLAFGQGRKDDFKRQATALVAAGRATGPLLYALAEAETRDRAWDAALQTTRRLVSTFRDDPVADDALARLGLEAVAEKRWALGSEALSLLRSTYPRSEFVDVTLIPAMEAMIEIGAPAAATAPLQQFVSSAPNDVRATEAWLLLARAREATGDPRGAIEAYAGAERSARGKKLGTDVMLRHARLLVQDKRWESARPVLTGLIRVDEPAAVAEASYYMGLDQRAQGDALRATEYLMTAAYLAPDSEFGQKALLAAAEAFAAMKTPDAKAMALSVYDKLLGQANVSAELRQTAKSARDALAAR